MKTFKEFRYISNIIIEKYIEPNPKMIQKAKSKGITGDKLRKVERGADNPNIDMSPQKGVEISHAHDITTIHHPESGISFDLRHRGRKLNGKSHYDVSWWDNKQEKGRTSAEKLKLARTAKNIWFKHAQHTLPHGSIVSNTPASPSHQKAYERAGMGPMMNTDNSRDDRWMRQYSTVGRMPSPRQQAKGKKSRLSPMNPPDEFQPIH